MMGGTGEIVSLLRRGRLDEAERCCEALLSECPEDHEALNLLGVIATEKGDYRRAAGLLERAVALRPGVWQYLYHLGNALMAAGQYDGARRAYEMAVEAGPDMPDPFINLGKLLIDTSRSGLAVRVLERAAVSWPDAAEARFNLAVAMAAVGRRDEAGREFDAAVRLAPGLAPRCNAIMGRGAGRAGNASRREGCGKLFILGAYKTATSTMVGMLNAHPGIFILYETDLGAGEISKYGRMFLGRFPDARFLFRHRWPLACLYDELADYLGSIGAGYRYVGDKLPFLDSGIAGRLVGGKVVYCVRDIRTWLAKEAVIAIFCSRYDLVPVALDYCVAFIESFLLEDVFHCRMESLIGDNRRVIDELGVFLGMDLMPHLERWWDKVVVDDVRDPKSALPWWKSHPSSLREPSRLDTVVELKPHPFWDGLLPLFDKYYRAAPGQRFSPAEIAGDVERVRALLRFSPLPVDEAYVTTRQMDCSRTSRMAAG